MSEMEQIWDRLEISLTEDERRDQCGDLSSTVGYSFTRRRDGTGDVSIAERWADMDELWSNGVSISLPPRILAAFIAWVSSPPSTVVPGERK